MNIATACAASPAKCAKNSGHYQTFIDCDLICPATIYFQSNNQANPIRPPTIDAVWLAPTAKFGSAFSFNNCIFRNCSFQRITLLASIENYLPWKDNTGVNWLSIPPTPEMIIERLKMIRDDLLENKLPIPPNLEADMKAMEGAATQLLNAPEHSEKNDVNTHE